LEAITVKDGQLARWASARTWLPCAAPRPAR
jgi:hypothetical protein